MLLMSSRNGAVRTIPGLKKLANAVPLIRFSGGREPDWKSNVIFVGLGWTSNSFEFDSPYAVAAMVAAGHGFAITTPVCFAEVEVSSKGLLIARLPGPQISRKLTMVARYRELGNIPRDLADVVRKVMAGTGIAGLTIGA